MALGLELKSSVVFEQGRRTCVWQRCVGSGGLKRISERVSEIFRLKPGLFKRRKSRAHRCNCDLNSSSVNFPKNNASLLTKTGKVCNAAERCCGCVHNVHSVCTQTFFKSFNGFERSASALIACDHWCL